MRIIISRVQNLLEYTYRCKTCFGARELPMVDLSWCCSAEFFPVTVLGKIHQFLCDTLIQQSVHELLYLGNPVLPSCQTLVTCNPEILFSTPRENYGKGLPCHHTNPRMLCSLVRCGLLPIAQLQRRVPSIRWGLSALNIRLEKSGDLPYLRKWWVDRNSRVFQVG